VSHDVAQGVLAVLEWLSASALEVAYKKGLHTGLLVGAIAGFALAVFVQQIANRRRAA
jgi:hypothetical protein